MFTSKSKNAGSPPATLPEPIFEQNHQDTNNFCFPANQKVFKPKTVHTRTSRKRLLGSKSTPGLRSATLFTIFVSSSAQQFENYQTRLKILKRTISKSMKTFPFTLQYHFSSIKNRFQATKIFCHFLLFFVPTPLPLRISH